MRRLLPIRIEMLDHSGLRDRPDGGRRSASAQQSVNFYLGGFVPPSLELARCQRRAASEHRRFSISTWATFTGVTFGGECLVATRRQVRRGPRRRLLPALGCRRRRLQRVRHDRQSDSGDAAAAHRAVHRDGPLAAARPHAACSRTSAPASASSPGTTARPATSSPATTSRSSTATSPAAGRRPGR